MTSSNDSLVAKACEKCYSGDNISNCSGFVRAVAKELNISLTGNADAIVKHISSSASWTKLDGGAQAREAAANGKFVIAGLKSSDHSKVTANGHVAVVVTGDLYRNKYPKCWCGGSERGRSKGDKSVGEVWNSTDRDNVIYRQAPG